VAVSAAGQPVIAGYTRSSDLPLANPRQNSLAGFQDAFAAQLAADGAGLVFSTYLGGASFDEATAVAVGAGGSVYLAGNTNSLDFPLLNPAQNQACGGLDGFAAALGPGGGPLVYSTYVCGSADDYPLAVAADPTGGAVIAGYTQSADFPAVNAFQRRLDGPHDGFVVRIPPLGGPFVYATYLGGESSDILVAVAVDATGRAYVAGDTASTQFPVRNFIQQRSAGGFDAFVSRFGPTGTLDFSTYLGGSGEDAARALGLDAAGRLWAGGWTSSSDVPTTPDAVQASNRGGADAWIFRIDFALSASLGFSSYLGGTALDWANGIAADALGGVAVAGLTDSADLPLERPAQIATGGLRDGFAARLCTVTPPTGRVGNALRAVKRGLDVALDWSLGPLLPPTYAIHRDADKTAIEPPASTAFALVTATATYTDPGAVAPAPPLWFYEVYGQACGATLWPE
jgi:hypothetical protein